MPNFPFKAEKNGSAKHIHATCGKRFNAWQGKYYPVCPICGKRDGSVQL